MMDTANQLVDSQDGFVAFYDPETEHVWFKCPHEEFPYPLPNSVWTVKSINPLTVLPSVNCTDCGCHAFITDSRWSGSPG